jgi:hypothetical protein
MTRLGSGREVSAQLLQTNMRYRLSEAATMEEDEQHQETGPNVARPRRRERFDIMKHDGCGFDEIEAQASVSPLWKSWT